MVLNLITLWVDTMSQEYEAKHIKELELEEPQRSVRDSATRTYIRPYRKIL